MIKISGLEHLTKQLEQARSALSALDGDLATVSFDPDDPASIDAAIQQAEALIDSKVQAWPNNPLVLEIATGMKEQCRNTIVGQAAQARLENKDA